MYAADSDGQPDDPLAILDASLNDPNSELTLAERASLTAWREQQRPPVTANPADELLAAAMEANRARGEMPIDHYLNQVDLPPAVHNLLVGVTEAGKDPLELMRLGAALHGLSSDGAPMEDQVANMVEALRRQRHVSEGVHVAAADTGTRTDAPGAEISAWDAGPRGAWEDAVQKLLMAAGMDENSAFENARNLMSGTNNPLIEIGLADFEPATLAYEAKAALDRGDYLDAALTALGLTVFARPAAKAAKGVVKAAVSGPASGSMKAQAGKAISPSILAGGAAAGAGLAAGMTADDAEAAPLSGMVAKAIRALSRTATKPEIEAAILKADPKLNPGKVATYTARVETLNRETSGMPGTTELWKGRIGMMPLGHAEMGGYHVMLEHRGDLIDILRASGLGVETVNSMSSIELLQWALRAIDAAPAYKDGTRHIGKLTVKVVKNGPEKIGTFYVIERQK